MSLAAKLRRLGQMDLAEVRFRMAQHWRIRQERMTQGRNGHAALRVRPDAESLATHFAGRRQPRFFWPLDERATIVDALRHHPKQHVERVLQEADRLLAHRLRIFSYPQVDAGPQIPWRRDLVHGVESGLDHWSEIRYLDFTAAGDSKIVWEPNRFQQAFLLGQGWLLTGDEKCAEECLAQFEHWTSENPRRRGINWASSLEAAFRIWSWLWMLYLLDGSRALSGARSARVLAEVAEHAGFIEENLSTYFAPNTHLLGEGFSLYCAGLLLPELAGADGWRAAGRRILEEQMERQVRPDGTHAEQSLYYHRYATDFFLCAAILAERNAAPFSAAWRARLERMCDFLLHTQWPDGLHPMTGDDDGGRLLAFAPPDEATRASDYRSTLATAAVFFHRGDFAAAAGSCRAETMWLLGGGAESQFAELAARQQARPGSGVFRDGGQVVQRAESQAGTRMLVFDGGPMGMGACGHGHADALQVLCSADGVEWLVDAGTFVYTSDRAARDAFRSTHFHSTLCVDGKNQAVATDFFKWSGIPRVRLELALDSPWLDVAMASHDGYGRTPHPVLHRRSVVFFKPNAWLITDEVSGLGEHELQFHWTFSPSVTLDRVVNGWLARQGNASLLLQTPAGLTSRVVRGQERPLHGWISGNYGHRGPAPVLAATCRAKLAPNRTLRFHWRLQPAPTAADTDVELHDEPGPGLRMNLRTGDSEDVLLVRAQETRDSGARYWTDADAAWLRRSRALAPGCESITILNGGWVTDAGRTLVRAESMLDRLHVELRGGHADVAAQPPRRMAILAAGTRKVRVNGAAAEFRRDGDYILLEGGRS